MARRPKRLLFRERDLEWLHVDLHGLGRRRSERLQAMVPIGPGQQVLGVTSGGNSVPFVVAAIEGCELRILPGVVSAYQVTFAQDTTPPAVTSTSPAMVRSTQPEHERPRRLQRAHGPRQYRDDDVRAPERLERNGSGDREL